MPCFNSIPEPLRQLTKENIWALCPFDLDCSVYERGLHGFLVKTGTITWKPCNIPIKQKIESILNDSDHQKSLHEYEYLMNSEDSCYSRFVLIREQLLRNSTLLNPFDLDKMKGIECALWPNLYLYTDWCESMISGATTKQSAKISFYAKVCCEFPGYALHFHLLQFHHDRCIYKVISGAINTGQLLNCSHAWAFNTKPFSSTSWQWQHRHLLDAVAQFSLPDVFIIISPFEWSLPFPEWLDEIGNKTGRVPTELAAFDTQHIAHTLEQIVQGYLCSSNNNRWTNHIFSYNRISGFLKR